MALSVFLPVRLSLSFLAGAVQGLFGIDFTSDSTASATINDPLSRMEPTWCVCAFSTCLCVSLTLICCNRGAAVAKFVLRGTDVTLTATPSQQKLEIEGVVR